MWTDDGLSWGGSMNVRVAAREFAVNGDGVYMTTAQERGWPPESLVCGAFGRSAAIVHAEPADSDPWAVAWHALSLLRNMLDRADATYRAGKEKADA